MEVKDQIKPFLPKEPPRLIIMGTMAAIKARVIDGQAPKDAFFYHDNRNKFWRIMGEVFGAEGKHKDWDIAHRKQLLNKWRIGVCNVIDSMEVPKSDAMNVRDTVIFNAHKRGRVQVKQLSPQFKRVLKTTPVAFTCLAKPPLTRLLQDFYAANGLDRNLVDAMIFLHTPAFGSPEKIRKDWQQKLSGLL